MLKLAMSRIKFPVALQNILINLFSKRRNRVIGHYGLTDPYNVLIRIDQGEVISPLLWCIYYDSLLCEIAQQKDLGYTISHSWKTNINDSVSKCVTATITSQAYIDDTTWINH